MTSVRELFDSIYILTSEKVNTVPFFLIGTHTMKGWTATTRYGVTKKRSTKRLKKEPTAKRCLLILDLRPFRS